jgi:hypothetical protein
MVDTFKNVTAKDVEDFHRKSDLNKRPESQHHSLGNGANQASPGNHTHNGQNSLSLFSGLSITGSRSTNTADVLRQILIVLESVGLDDLTVA